MQPGLVWVLLATAGCATQTVRQVIVGSSLAQTISLLGDTLYGLPLDPAGGPARVRRLGEARDLLSRDSSSLQGWLQLGASNMEMGRLREAVGVYTRAAEQYFNDPRVWRGRGEALLRLRYLDRAIADFRQAGLLALQGPKVFLEAPPNPDDSIGKPSWNNLTTLQFQVPFLLGFALYCKGDYASAATALSEAIKTALTTDEASQALLWLFFAARRLGDGPAATHLLGLAQPEWAAAGTPAITMLLGYRGLIPTDSIRFLATHARGEAQALYSYGIAFFLLLKPEQRESAELWLEQARSGAAWAALPYLAAEADLARLRNGGKLIVR